VLCAHVKIAKKGTTPTRFLERKNWKTVAMSAVAERLQFSASQHSAAGYRPPFSSI
jgi:hypothetical protein